MRNMKRGFKTLGIALLLCCVFALASCGGGENKGVFVQPSVKVLSGSYGDVFSFVGGNIIGKDKNGDVRLFKENGAALSGKYDDMVFYGAYAYNSADSDCLVGWIGSAGFILDAKTGKEKAGPFKNLSAITGNSLYFSYAKEGGLGLVYRKDFSVVQYQDKPFIYDSTATIYGDAISVNSDKYSEKDASGVRANKRFFVLGGKVIGEISTSGTPVSSVNSGYRDELYYVTLSGADAKQNVYGGGANLTSNGYTAFTSSARISLDNNENYYFIAATKDTSDANKYCVLSYKAGSGTITQTYAGSAAFNFNSSRAYQYALRDNKLINLITGAEVCGTASSISTVNESLVKNNGMIGAGSVRGCQYLNTTDNKYHIIGIDGVEKAVSSASWYRYLNGKFVVSQTDDTNVKFGGKTYDAANVGSIGRSVIRARNADGKYDLYNADGALIKADTDSCALYTSEADNFQYYVIEYKNASNEDRTVFYADGKLSEEFLKYYDLGIYVGGKAAHIAGAVTSIKKLKETGQATETEYNQYRVFDFNTNQFVTAEAYNLSVSQISAGLNNEAKIFVRSIIYNFDSDNKRESFSNYIYNFINTGKSSEEIKTDKDMSYGNAIFTGVTYGRTVYDGAKGSVYTEVYGDNGKKVKTIKNFSLGWQEDIYFAAENKPYIAFSDEIDNYGMYDKNFNVTIKPIYDRLDISSLGAVFAYKASGFGILGLNGRTIVPVKNMGASNDAMTAFISTDSIQYVKLYDGTGKKLISKVYSIGDFNDMDYIFKLKEDRTPEPYPDYMKVGMTPQKEYVDYGKVFDGKYWRIVKSVTPQ